MLGVAAFASNQFGDLSTAREKYLAESTDAVGHSMVLSRPLAATLPQLAEVQLGAGGLTALEPNPLAHHPAPEFWVSNFQSSAAEVLELSESWLLSQPKAESQRLTRAWAW